MIMKEILQMKIKWGFFSDFYSQKYAQFHENILSPFIQYDKIAKNKETLTSKQFELLVSEVFNARNRRLFQFNNLKDEKSRAYTKYPKIRKFRSIMKISLRKSITSSWIPSEIYIIHYPQPQVLWKPSDFNKFSQEETRSSKRLDFRVRNEEEEDSGGWN